MVASLEACGLDVNGVPPYHNKPRGGKIMSSKPASRKDPKGIRSMTPRAIERAALADPDAHPLTPADLKRMKRTPQIKIIRRALGLTKQS